MSQKIVKHRSDVELEDFINEWLDTMMETYGEVLEEWKNAKIVQPRPGAHVEFSCNNCGRCCNFENHWVWVYPSDMVHWLKKIDSDRLIPLLLGILFPVEDNEGEIGYGLPSQKIIIEKYKEFMENQNDSKLIQRTYDMILKELKKLNPEFNEKSEYCIFYNPLDEHHCQIYNHRPLQCRVYPYDFPQFSKIVIPDNLKDKYGAIDDNLDDLPECTPSAYKGGRPQEGILINEAQIEMVTCEKANYITSIYTQDLNDTDISDVFLELFHKDILSLDRAEVIQSKSSKQEIKKQYHNKTQSHENKELNQRYIAGKRPESKNHAKKHH